MSSTFEMKDIGETFYILGVKIHSDHSHKLVTLLQEHYIKNILEWFNMQDCNPIYTPFARGENLGKEMGAKASKEKKKITNVPYFSVVGCLMCYDVYKTIYIYYVVGMVSRYQENPRMMHWKIVKRILRYLIGIVDYSFCYQGKELCLWVAHMPFGQVI